jgi:hypothetical protein
LIFVIVILLMILSIVLVKHYGLVKWKDSYNLIYSLSVSLLIFVSALMISFWDMEILSLQLIKIDIKTLLITALLLQVTYLLNKESNKDEGLYIMLLPVALMIQDELIQTYFLLGILLFSGFFLNSLLGKVIAVASIFLILSNRLIVDASYANIFYYILIFLSPIFVYRKVWVNKVSQAIFSIIYIKIIIFRTNITLDTGLLTELGPWVAIGLVLLYALDQSSKVGNPKQLYKNSGRLSILCLMAFYLTSIEDSALFILSILTIDYYFSELLLVLATKKKESRALLIYLGALLLFSLPIPHTPMFRLLSMSSSTIIILYMGAGVTSLLLFTHIIRFFQSPLAHQVEFDKDIRPKTTTMIFPFLTFLVFSMDKRYLSIAEGIIPHVAAVSGITITVLLILYNGLQNKIVSEFLVKLWTNFSNFYRQLHFSRADNGARLRPEVRWSRAQLSVQSKVKSDEQIESVLVNETVLFIITSMALAVSVYLYEF